MKICKGCGGVLGRDCFNEQECVWIGEQQELGRLTDESRREDQQMEYEMLGFRCSQLEELLDRAHSTICSMLAYQEQQAFEYDPYCFNTYQLWFEDNEIANNRQE